MTDAERRAALDAIAAEVAVCKACRLHQGRTRSVPGEGTEATEVMFVGEGPGQNEDLQGRPFVGRAGDLLVKLLASIGWSRGEVFIANVVKCRPPGNRDPEPDEIAACAPFLARQMAALDPALVVTLGRFSMARFRPGAKISQVHGTFTSADPGAGAGNAITFSMYHPAAALRQGSLEETMFADMAGVPAALVEARTRRAAKAAVAAVEPPMAGAPAPAVETTATLEPAPAAASLPEPAADPEPVAEAAPEPDEPPVNQSLEPAPAPVTVQPEVPSQGAGEDTESSPAAQLSLF
jgi:uracil-DNA glycosylase